MVNTIAGYFTALGTAAAKALNIQGAGYLGTGSFTRAANTSSLYHWRCSG